MHLSLRSVLPRAEWLCPGQCDQSDSHWEILKVVSPGPRKQNCGPCPEATFWDRKGLLWELGLEWGTPGFVMEEARSRDWGS